MRKIQDLDVQGKTVLVRSDVNVPFEHGVIQDEFRLEQSLGTIEYAAGKGAVVVVLAHLGRPNGTFQQELSLQPIAKRLSKLLEKPVLFGEESLAPAKPGAVVMLENLRFHKGEEENNKEFAERLAQLGDIYVDDAFGACHRAHASIVGIPEFLPSAAGLLLQKEIAILGKVKEKPEKPLVVVVGGTKVETKKAFLQNISKNASAILLGDLISKEVQEKGLELAKDAELVLATDGVDGDYDLGPKTIEQFEQKIAQAKTVFWAGPLGMVEEEQYEKGSLAVAEAILQSGAYAVAGGGDLAAFLGKHNLRKKFNHVSTGGGAMLAFLAGEELPGLKALEADV